jgi:hypothetical protein
MEDFGLQLEILGQQGLDDLRAKLDAAKAAGGEVAAALGRGEITAAEADAEYKQLAASVKNLESAIRGLEAAQGRQAAALHTAAAAAVAAVPATYELADAYDLVESEMTRVAVAAPAVAKAFDWTTIVSPKVRRLSEDFDFASINLRKVEPAAQMAGRGMKNWGQAAFFASQGLEDLQYGLGGVVNNIPTLVMSLGGPLGVAAAVSVVAVGVNQLYKNWDRVTGLFQAKNPFPQAAEDLDGLKQKLDKVNDGLKELRKFDALTVAQEDRFDALTRSKAELDKQVKFREEMERLAKIKADGESRVIAAFEEAVKLGGGGKVLDDLREAAILNEKNLDPILKGVSEGQIKAYDKLIKALELGLGPGSDFEKALKNLRPNLNVPVVDVFERAAHEAKLANEEEARRLSKELGKQGAELEGEFLGAVADEARKTIGRELDDKLKAIVVRARAQGDNQRKELARLEQEVAAAIADLFPTLAAFPALAKSVAQELARKIRVEVDDAVKELMRLEGLTKREAVRRLNQEAAEKAQGKAEDLARDEFTEFARRRAAQQARLQPGLPPLPPEEARKQGEELRGQLKDLGVGPGEMKRIGQLLNNREAQRRIPAALEALQGQGLGEPEAIRALPDFFRQLGRGGNFAAALNRMANDREQAERRAFNEAALGRPIQPRAFVPRGPLAPGFAGGALNADQQARIDEQGRDAEGRQEIARQAIAAEKAAAGERKAKGAAAVERAKEQDRRRREAAEERQRGFRAVAPNGPGVAQQAASAAPAIQATQEAVGLTQAALAQTQARLAKLEQDARVLKQRARSLTNLAAVPGTITALNSGTSVA